METIKNMTNLNKLKDNTSDTISMKSNRFSIDSDNSIDDLTDNMMEIIKKKLLATKDNNPDYYHLDHLLNHLLFIQ